MRRAGTYFVNFYQDGEPSVNVKVCDFESGSDEPCGEDGDLFSVWF